MKSRFRILHLEDSEPDCDLIRRLLVEDGIDCEIIRCENREKFIESLEKKDFDLIFADCTVPHFNGHHALAVAREMAPEIPFIFVSGTIEEDSAIESLRNGATDYVLKEHLSRLVPAVRLAVVEADEHAKSLEMEHRLRQAQRLEAVGTLAGGLAHDFNNILTIIKSYTALLPLESERPERVRQIAEIIDRASVRGSELVSQVLAFSRKTDGAFTPTPLNERVREIAPMLQSMLPAEISLEYQLGENLPEIYTDHGQIERVLLNLATNARDAMPEGGKLIFTTSLVPVGEAPSHERNEGGDFLCLSVTDTGCGMEEATVQRIFEPFFTTKPRGKGTGLGMPVVYGLMQSHNGLVDVKSKPGIGTCISLFFPVPTRPLPSRTTQAPKAPLTVEGTETVLVVDDEPDVLEFLQAILQLHGYSVLSARSGEAALGMIPASPDAVHVLLSDVGLSGIDGFELTRRAREIQPGLKTILCSGCSDALLEARLAQANIEGFVAKPYDTHELLRTIRGVLDRERQGK